jgi:hypothetical protein
MDERRELAYWNLGKWILVALLCAVIPASAFNFLLYWPWDFVAQPNWRRLLVPIGPLYRLLVAPRSRGSLFQGSFGGIIDRGGSCRFDCLAAHSQSLGVGWRNVVHHRCLVVCCAALVKLRQASTPDFLLNDLLDCGFFGFCFPLALANAFIVSSRAEAIAGHRPY